MHSMIIGNSYRFIFSKHFGSRYNALSAAVISTTQTEKHYHEQLMLYTCWRHEDHLLGNAQTYEERYEQVQT